MRTTVSKVAVIAIGFHLMAFAIAVTLSWLNQP